MQNKQKTDEKETRKKRRAYTRIHRYSRLPGSICCWLSLAHSLNFFHRRCTPQSTCTQSAREKKKCTHGAVDNNSKIESAARALAHSLMSVSVSVAQVRQRRDISRKLSNMFMVVGILASELIHSKCTHVNRFLSMWKVCGRPW